jgi:hypothetical protein
MHTFVEREREPIANSRQAKRQIIETSYYSNTYHEHGVQIGQ